MKDNNIPPRPPSVKRIDLQPTDVEGETYERFARWFEAAGDEELHEVLWDFAGAEWRTLLSLANLWLYPGQHFDEPEWLEYEKELGGNTWVSDFDLYHAILSSDMECWLDVGRVERHLQGFYETDLTDAAPAGHLLNLVVRGMGKLREEALAGEVDAEWWFRLDWETILKWWESALERRAGRFQPDGYVYVLGGGGFHKIGKAANLDRRIRQLAIQLPWPVSVEHVIECEDHSLAEKSLHERFADKRAHGEWFRLEPDDLADLKAIERMRGPRPLGGS
jgi:hypothetical protein